MKSQKLSGIILYQRLLIVDKSNEFKGEIKLVILMILK